MLVLQRFIGEEILIGSDIRIMLVDIRGDDSARIGIDAPKHIPVDRLEVAKAIARGLPRAPFCPSTQGRGQSSEEKRKEK